MKEEIRLTPREQQIFDYFMLTGAGNKHIARHFSLCEPTIKFHMKTILKKYGVRTRIQLLLYARK